MIPKIFKVIGVGLILTLSINSCTDLTVSPPSAVTGKTFFKSKQQFIAALGVAYSHLSNYTGSHPMTILNETPSDEMVVPQRGKDWYDGGTHIRLNQHTWKYQDAQINSGWTFLFGGVSSTNRLIFQFTTFAKQGKLTQKKASQFISELKVLRAFYYYWLLDMYGNVPIVTKFKGADKAPANNKDFQTGRNKLFKFVEEQIKDNIQNLSRKADISTFARVDVWVAHFLLAKLYLNAEVYTGTPRWQDALAQCDSIINSGKFRLASNYFANFDDNTQDDPEMIWAIPYDKVHFHGNNWDAASLHYLNQQTYNLTFLPYNGFAAETDFYYSFKDNDVRRQGFLVGYQYDRKGNHLIDEQAFAGEPHGDTLYFTPHINELQPRAWREAGVRFIKYKPDLGSTVNLSNDAPIMRYADVLLMKAEVLWRMNKAPGVALHLVNMVRERAGLSDWSSLSAYKLLKAREHELYIENWRRQDLIRFNGGLHWHIKPNGQRGAKYAAGATAFNDAYGFKPVDQPYHNVFPIPKPQMDSNPNLIQNPGYSGE